MAASITNLKAEFPDISRADVPLAPFTWLKIGGPAQLFIEPRSVDEAVTIITQCHLAALPVHVLGGGSNLLKDLPHLEKMLRELRRTLSIPMAVKVRIG